MIRIFLFAIASIISAAEYKIVPLGTSNLSGEKFPDSFENHAKKHSVINDNGCLCSFSGSNLYLSKKNGELMFLGGITYTYSQNNLINNRNQVVFPQNYCMYIWDSESGLRLIDKISGGSCNSMHIAALNDQGQLVGRSNDGHAFFWDNGNRTDMGIHSSFAEHFRNLGYCVTDIVLTALNNNGEIAGYFSYGKYNERKRETVTLGKKPFFWNGKLHVIDLPFYPEHWTNYEGIESVQLNNKGYVVISFQQENHHTFLWHSKEKVKHLQGFRAVSINDSNTILGYSYTASNDRWKVWHKDTYTPVSKLLGQATLANLASPYSDSYDVEVLDHLVQINNKGQILALGRIWGEWHPCIIEPVSECHTQTEVR
jgi:hypothetical protein